MNDCLKFSLNKILVIAYFDNRIKKDYSIFSFCFKIFYFIESFNEN
jgi:hypothetical protein